jgi:Concanavalin A-like lectin/glucanases superfamily
MYKQLSTAMLIVSALVLAPTAFAVTNDQVNHWKFDEGMGRSVNDSVGGKNGVMVGTSTGFGWASGKINTAVGMDGGAGEKSIVIPDGTLSGSQGTIALWFSMHDLSDRNVLFSGKSTYNNYIYSALYIDYNGRPEFQFRTTQDGVDRKAQGGKVLNKNEWYNLVLTADGQSYHMYVNGEEITVYGENIGRWFSDLTSHVYAYRIGAIDSNPLSGSFNGYLDDVRIYNRALSFAEVVALYGEGNAGAPTNPVLATSTPVTVEPPVTPIEIIVPTPPTTPVVTTPPPVVSTPSDDAKKAMIQGLIKQIMALIVELQKQLLVLKANQATGGTY